MLEKVRRQEGTAALALVRAGDWKRGTDHAETGGNAVRCVREGEDGRGDARGGVVWQGVHRIGIIP